MHTPIPNPEPGTCPRCDARVSENKTGYCPSCGALLQSAPKSVSGIKIFGAICLILLALPLAGASACFLLFSDLNNSPNGAMIGIALGCLLCAALCAWGFVALLKR